MNSGHGETKGLATKTGEQCMPHKSQQRENAVTRLQALPFGDMGARGHVIRPPSRPPMRNRNGAVQADKPSLGALTTASVWSTTAYRFRRGSAGSWTVAVHADAALPLRMRTASAATRTRLGYV